MNKKNIKRMLGIACLSLLLVGCKRDDFSKAYELYQNEQYEDALAIFKNLENYRGSDQLAKECQEKIAEKELQEEKMDNDSTNETGDDNANADKDAAEEATAETNTEKAVESSSGNAISDEYQQAIDGVFAYLADPVLNTTINLRLTSVKTEFTPLEADFKEAIVAALENAGYSVELADDIVDGVRYDGVVYSYTSYNISGNGIYQATIGLHDDPELKEISVLVYLEEFE